MATLNIKGINKNNDFKINSIAGIAGFSKSVRYANECEAAIDLKDREFLLNAGIAPKEVEKMIATFVIEGFSVSIAA